jgi:hypothetical protein
MHSHSIRSPTCARSSAISRRKTIEPKVAADDASSGLASFVVEDPDGNTTLFDQHM